MFNNTILQENKETWWLTDSRTFLSRVRRWLRLIVKSSPQIEAWTVQWLTLKKQNTDMQSASNPTWRAVYAIKSYYIQACRIPFSVSLWWKKRNPQAQIWLWIFLVVIKVLSGANYIVLYLSHIPMWVSALPSEKSQEKGEIISMETNCFLRKRANNGRLEADILGNNLGCIKWSQLKHYQTKIFEQLYIFLNEAFQNTGIMLHSTLYILFFLFCFFSQII